MRRRQCVCGRRAQNDAIEERQLHCRVCEPRMVVPRNDDLRRVQPEIERIEQGSVREQLLSGGRQHALNQIISLPAPSVVAGKHGKPDEIPGCD